MAEKLIIIGSGPAGWTAALYSARAELSPTLFEGLQPGGQLTTTTEVENFPGFPEGIGGTEMMMLFKKQAERFGTKVISEHVTEVDFSERPFKISTPSKTYEAESVIISTGATARYLGIPGEEKLMGKGVSACATCDGFFYKGQTIVMIGGGDSAAEESTFMTKFADKVYLLVRRDEMRASKIMQKRVMDNPKIEVLFDTVATEVLGEEKVSGVKIKNSKTGEESQLDVTGYFAAIGHKPNTELFKGVLDMDELGYLVTKPHSSETNIEGVFAAGDVADHKYRQAITAAGMGCMASLDAEKWLAAQE